jgi:hypothetical protein
MKYCLVLLLSGIGSALPSHLIQSIHQYQTPQLFICGNQMQYPLFVWEPRIAWHFDDIMQTLKTISTIQLCNAD